MRRDTFFVKTTATSVHCQKRERGSGMDNQSDVWRNYKERWRFPSVTDAGGLIRDAGGLIRGRRSRQFLVICHECTYGVQRTGHQPISLPILLVAS